MEAFNRVILGEAISGLQYVHGSTSHSEGHKHYYYFAGLATQLAQIGFVNIQRVSTNKSPHEHMAGLETRPARVDLIIECEKPYAFTA